MTYARKYHRTLCIDWTDSAWSDGTEDFSTYFEICGLPVISREELWARTPTSVWPAGWGNQWERRADRKFIYNEPYACTLPDEDRPEELLVYAGTGLRNYFAANLCELRVLRTVRNQIIKQLQRFADYDHVVHLRGTDRVTPEKHAEYVAAICKQLNNVERQTPILVVSDCLPLFIAFRAEFPAAVLRTPLLESYSLEIGTHFQIVIPKHDQNVELLIDFFLITYAKHCYHDPDTLFAAMARFLRASNYCDILGYDR